VPATTEVASAETARAMVKIAILESNPSLDTRTKGLSAADSHSQLLLAWLFKGNHFINTRGRSECIVTTTKHNLPSLCRPTCSVHQICEIILQNRTTPRIRLLHDKGLGRYAAQGYRIKSSAAQCLQRIKTTSAESQLPAPTALFVGSKWVDCQYISGDVHSQF
jgi:hypothetical protein